MIIANALAGRIALNSARILPDCSSQSMPPESHARKSGHASSTYTPMPADTPPQRTDAPAIPPSPAPNADEPTDADDASLREHFQRGLGAYPLRNREPAALLTVHNSTLPAVSVRNTGCALLASATDSDPKTRKQALRDDRAGWTAAERAEIANHMDNGSWELIDRKDVPSGRGLVRLIWVYKRKRNGSLKARLCVQGCAQIPG
eukprot:3504327-Pleurochrysis_carterae.AAC.1